MNKFRRQIASLDKQIQGLQNRKKAVELEMMLSCDHPIDQIYEVGFGAHYSNSVPYKFCKNCGFGESGWRTPLFFQEAYRTEVPQVSANFARKYLVRILSNDEMSAIEYPNREEYVHLQERVAPFKSKKLERKDLSVR